MKRLFDEKDGWPTVTTSEFVGQLITAFLIVFCLWAMTVVGSGIYVEPQP